VGLTNAFFAFYTPIWVGISLASIAVEAVATFQILGKKINPVTKMSRFTRPFGLGVLAGGVAGNPGRSDPPSKPNTKPTTTTTSHKPKKQPKHEQQHRRHDFGRCSFKEDHLGGWKKD
jgi:hypothetical protein